MITQHRSTDSLLCPVKIWAKIVQRLWNYPSSSGKMMVNSFLIPNNKIHLFTGSKLLKRLLLAAASLGPDTLGFTADQIGLHSARSGAAMAMFLAGGPVFTIMLLGRWSSDAFLRYIRKQVKEFSRGISNRMIQNETFFTIAPDNHSPQLTFQDKSGLSFQGTILPLARAFGWPAMYCHKLVNFNFSSKDRSNSSYST